MVMPKGANIATQLPSRQTDKANFGNPQPGGNQMPLSPNNQFTGIHKPLGMITVLHRRLDGTRPASGRREETRNHCASQERGKTLRKIFRNE